MWMENGKNKLLPKCKGTLLKVSGYSCDCHVLLKSYTTFEAGIAREGWFTNKGCRRSSLRGGSRNHNSQLF